MIKVKPIILFFLVAFSTNAQIINIPDANFKTKLVSADVSNTIAKDLSGNYFKIDTNNDGEIQESEALQVSYIEVTNANIFSITGIDKFLNITSLECEYNHLTTIDTSVLTSLLGLYCSNNQITSLDLSNNINLESLYVRQNFISTLVLPNSLTVLSCANNNITNLDISQCINLTDFYCENNNLIYLNLKNGKFLNTTGTYDPFQLNVTFANNPSLKHLCYDQISGFTSQFNTLLAGIGSSSLVANSYCSFIPGGNFNTISGKASLDNENDGCDINDEVFEFLRVTMSDGTNSGSTITNFEGNYTYYTNAGNFNLTPQLENPTYFSVFPTSVLVTFTDNNNNTSSNNFCITANGVYNDLEVVLAQVTPARPGLDGEYSLVYKNKGNQPLSGTVSVTYDDDKLDFVSSSITPSSQLPASLSWDYINLLPFENRSITFTLNVNSPQETPAVNNGAILAFTANITPLLGDEVPADNTFVYNQTVVGSFDPNDIYCLEGAVIDPALIGNYLHYNVRFENTGTAAAENIVVATIINPAKYDLNTLQVLNASHNVYTRINGDFVEFIFENIQLAGSPSGGHGNILFKIKSNPSLQTNDNLVSKADIFFDYNFPVATNDALSVFELLNNQDFDNDDSISIYPNPASSMVNINCNNIIKSVQLYDVQGRLLQKKLISEKTSSINISDKSNGIYFLKIISDKGFKVQKIVKK